ncbi:MAG: hypothetical protein ABSF22_12965 [Bryobacteraceae bacterium]
MRYWAFLIAKLVVAAGIVFGLGLVLNLVLTPHRRSIDGGPVTASYGMLLALVFQAVFAITLFWLIIRDQRLRCRTCLRRLRMPIQTGSWTNVLLGAPRTEYICTYGHGTLKVAELQITGHTQPDWEPHEDMWKELFSTEDTRRGR